MNRLAPFSLAALAALAAPIASAGTIAYSGPDTGPGGASGWQGDTVWYLNVEESNTEGSGGDDGMTASLFGSPTVLGDVIDFNPSDFSAQSEGGGTDVTAGDLRFMVVAQPGKAISNLLYSEAGDTTIAGSPSTDETLTSVTSDVLIKVLEIDGSPVGAPINVLAQLAFTPSDGDYLLNTDSGGGFFYQTTWSGGVAVDLYAELAAAGESFVVGATKVNVTVSNTLTAVSIDGTSAFIKKKDFDSVTVTTNVPEPATGAILIAGLVATGLCRVLH